MNLEDRIDNIHFPFDMVSFEDTSEDRIREITRYLFCETWYPKPNYSKNELLYEIIKLIKCNVRNANHIIEKMNDLGLILCMKKGFAHPDGSSIYDIVQFAIMRGYVSDKELENFEIRKDACDLYLQDNAERFMR